MQKSGNKFLQFILTNDASGTKQHFKIIEKKGKSTITRIDDGEMVGSSNSKRTMRTKSSYNANVNSDQYNLKNGNYSIGVNDITVSCIARRTQLNKNRKICDTSIVINDNINISMKIAIIDSNLSISQSYSCNNTNMNEISSICIDIGNCVNVCSDSFSIYNATGGSMTGQVFTGNNANNTNTIDGNENRITNINDSTAPNLPIIVDGTDGSGKMLTKNININQANMLIVISMIIHYPQQVAKTVLIFTTLMLTMDQVQGYQMFQLRVSI